MPLSTFSSDVMRSICRERMLKVLVITLALTLLVGFAFHSERSPAPLSDPVEDRYWALKTFFQKPQYNVVLVGDSRVYRGLAPVALTGALPNAKVINFGYSGSSLSPFMLNKAETLLDARAGMQVIVLGVTPFSLTDRAAQDEHYRSIKNISTAEAFERVYLVPLRMFFRPITVPDIQRWVRGAPAPHAAYHQRFFDDGWVASWYDVAQTREALPGYRGLFATSKVSADRCRDVFRTVREWKARGITTMGVRIPTTTEMVFLEESASGFREDWFISEFRRAGGIWLEVRGNDYRSYDGSHLEAESALKLSREIGQQIREAAAASRLSR